jgi:hypothetical protein
MSPRTVVLAICLIAATAAHAVRQPTGTGGLGGLVVPRQGRAEHASSADPSGGNVDFRGLSPGAELTLLDHQGAGVVHRFWMTFYPRASLNAPPEQVIAAHRQLILRMYWDGEKTPSVEVPIGDFFGVGFGEQRDYVSMPLSETSGGYNCYWPMPFHRSARWTLSNVSESEALVWWNIDFTAERAIARSVPHFHAQWRRENPTAAGQSYTILDARGTGHLAGVALFLHGLASLPPYGPLGFLEGDEQITIDGAPPLLGTGTEDYLGGGFYFDHGPVAGPYAGAVIRDEASMRVSGYRWHVEDALPFAKSIHVAIEHGTGNSVPTDYSSVAYFYQTEPHTPFPPLPDAAGLLP